jgi:hypothetical protein
MPAHFLVRKPQACSDHVVIQKAADGSWKVTNRLSAGIDSLWYADRDGRLFRSGPVAAGATAALAPGGEPAQGATNSLQRLYSGSWLGLPDKLAAAPRDVLRPGCYLALVDGAPYVESALRNAQARRSRSVVYGILKDPS